MTNKEAIKMQEAIKAGLKETGKDHPYRDALIPLMKESCDMAIEALETHPVKAVKDCRNCKHGGYNDHWETYFCYASDNCDNWDKWEPVISAQPEPIRINLNEPIKVKLTDWGKEIYYHQYDRTNQIAGREICKPRFPREDENGYTEFQLWCFIELYGMHMGMTLPNVIEPLEIVYER